MSTLHARLLAEIDRWQIPATHYNALRAVVELHAPEMFGGIWACLACSPGMPPQILIPAPCSTIQVIAEHLGVPIEDMSITDKESPTND